MPTRYYGYSKTEAIVKQMPTRYYGYSEKMPTRNVGAQMP